MDTHISIENQIRAYIRQMPFENRLQAEYSEQERDQATSEREMKASRSAERAQNWFWHCQLVDTAEIEAAAGSNVEQYRNKPDQIVEFYAKYYGVEEKQASIKRAYPVGSLISGHWHGLPFEGRVLGLATLALSGNAIAVEVACQIAHLPAVFSFEYRKSNVLVVDIEDSLNSLTGRV